MFLARTMLDNRFHLYDLRLNWMYPAWRTTCLDKQFRGLIDRPKVRIVLHDARVKIEANETNAVNRFIDLRPRRLISALPPPSL